MKYDKENEKRESRIDTVKLERAVTLILEAIGEDPAREGLKETPSRVAKMYAELTCGYSDDAAAHLGKTFGEDCKGMVLERDISFSSMCEHHLMPFFGKVHIAYIPNGKVAGLSKLARAVETYARRLQLQERMNAQIADAVYSALDAKGVFVVVEAQHTCMTARGVNKVGAETLSYAVRGDFPEHMRTEILAVVSAKRS